MSYISEIFERLDVQHIREFLLHGVECVEIDPKDYKTRIEEARQSAINMVKEKFSNMEENEKLTACIYDYASACEEVYMEIGLQSGFILAVQIMANTEPFYSDIKGFGCEHE